MSRDATDFYEQVCRYICHNHPTMEARPTILNLLHAHWFHMTVEHHDKILAQIVHLDDVELFAFLVDLGMSLLWEDYEAREPVDLVIVADAARIMKWCQGRHRYQDMVSSPRRVFEAIESGDTMRLARLLEFGASINESHAKHGNAVEMCLGD